VSTIGDNRAASIFDHQAERMRDLVVAASRMSPARTPNAKSFILAVLTGALSGDAALSDATLLQVLCNEAVACAEANEPEAAFAWGRAAYVAQRRFAHAWLLPLRFAFAAGKLKQTELQKPTPSEAHVIANIPQHIFQYWDTELIPPDVKFLMNEWGSQQNFAYTLLSDTASRHFIFLQYGKNSLDLYDSLPVAASKSDLLRLFWLLHHGGIYIDADERRHGDLSTLLPRQAGLVLNWTDASTPCINNWFIASRPGHPLLQRALRLAMDHIAGAKERRMAPSAWILTGPGVFTMAFMDLLCMSEVASTTLADVYFHSEADFRTAVQSEPNLLYKSDPSKNWRFSHYSWS
jgi:hypothetical protein